MDSLVPVCEEVPVRKCEMKPQPQEHVTLTKECRPSTTQVPRVFCKLALMMCLSEMLYQARD